MSSSSAISVVGPGPYARLLHASTDGVVVTHQPGAAHPADQRVHVTDPRASGLLGLPLGHGPRRARPWPRRRRRRRRRRPRLGRTRQHHMQVSCCMLWSASPGGQAADQPFHRPEQDPHLHFGRWRPRRRGSPATRGAASGTDRRGHGVLSILGATRVFDLLGTDPLDQRVEVLVGSRIGGDHPQRRSVAGVAPGAERAVTTEPVRR